ncbi:MAG: tetratricopeptide repeat protein [Bryobacterales bacterium]|nr:tetratricopeptide repeat protein [Bryobacterales bacterium]
MRLLPFILLGNLAAAPLVFRNTGPGVAYVGSKTCAGCHPAIYRGFTQTAMGRSITVPDASLLSAPVTVRNEKLNRDYRVYAEKGKLYQSESEHKDGALLYETAHELAFAIGSGESGISYAVRRGNHLFQAPLSYYSLPGKWELSPGFEEAGEGFNRPIYDACIICHAGRPNVATGRDGLYEDPPFAEMAIGCEKCHGPGQLHVSERIRGSRALPDTSIVNPARLPPRLAEDICMQCHQGGDARVLLPGRQYSDFRPSTPLARTVAIFGLPQVRKEEDLLEHHSSMKLSKCYRATNGKLSCLTCHDPHEQPAGTRAVSYFRGKCLGCHGEKSCTLGIDARRMRSPSDDCAACHMPKRDIEVISHSALTNHRIPARPTAAFSVPEPAANPQIPGLLLLNSGGPASLPLLTRLSAYGELMARAPELRTRYQALLEQARRALPEDPLVLAALGSEALAGNRPEAADLLAKAERKGKASSTTYVNLGEALSRAGRSEDAIAALKRGENSYPYSQTIRKHLILAFIRAKQYPQAKEAMERFAQDFPEDSFMRGLLRQVEQGRRQ